MRAHNVLYPFREFSFFYGCDSLCYVSTQTHGRYKSITVRNSSSPALRALRCARCLSRRPVAAGRPVQRFWGDLQPFSCRALLLNSAFLPLAGLVF